MGGGQRILGGSFDFWENRRAENFGRIQGVGQLNLIGK